MIDPLAIRDLDAPGRFLASDGVIKIIHNAAFEEEVLGARGWRIAGVYDTMTASMSRSGRVVGGHSLRAVARRELGVRLDKRQQTSDWTRRPLSVEQGQYAALDVEIIIDLYRVFTGEVVGGTS